MVAPWTAVPALVALTTDPNRALADRALRLLKREALKHAQFFYGRLAEGLVETADFQRRLWEAHHPGRPQLPGRVVMSSSGQFLVTPRL